MIDYRRSETETTDRYERGMARFMEVAGPGIKEFLAPLGDLGRYVVEFGYGDIYSRPGLSVREREIATVAMLIALGGREPQLRLHIGASLHVGLSAEEIEEVIIQAVSYAGFPAAINALTVLQEMTAATSDERR